MNKVKIIQDLKSMGYSIIEDYFCKEEIVEIKDSLRDTLNYIHPSNEKAERIWVLEGKVAVIAFNDGGEVVDVAELEAGRLSGVQVPPFTWHTYIMLTDRVITYETMEGVYDPVTWKTFADWAPTEDSVDKESYRESLRNSSLVFIAD